MTVSTRTIRGVVNLTIRGKNKTLKEKDSLFHKEELERKYNLLNETVNYCHRLAKIGFWAYEIQTGDVFFTEGIDNFLRCRFNDLNENLEGFLTYVHSDDMGIVKEATQNVLVGKEYDIEYRIVKPNEQVKYIRENTKVILDENNNPIKMVGIIKDITEKRELQKEVERKKEKINKIERRFNSLIKESVDVFVILDSDKRIVYLSEASEKVLGYKAQEHIGRKMYDYHEQCEMHKLTEMIELVLSEPEKRVTGDIFFKTKSGKVLYLEIYMQNFLHDSAIEGIVVNCRDVTNRMEAQERINYLSTHDQLTELPNNLYFENKLKLLCQHAKEASNSFAIFMLDIDSLRYIKNTLGYKVAEQYIVQIAQKLKSYCGTTKFICHYCNNRFIIIIEGIKTLDEYEIIIEDIYELFSRTIKVDKYELDVDISIGISTYKEDVQDNELLIRHAETAMFLAKSEGKNRYKFYSSDLNIQSYKQFVLRNDLRRSIENNQLKIYYQPIVNIRTNEILAAEALIRWEHPQWGVVSPIEFISIAEETGDIIKIGNWLFREVCRNYKQWLNNGLPKIKVSINFSSIQFFEANFVEDIINTINEYELNPKFLIMEITESILMEKSDKVISDIKRLQSHGIQIALDDFGTGYSSLAYLNSFNIDILKIDGSFIKNINIDETSTIITKYIIKMAQELKIKLVAEHIETLDQLDFLRKLKCYTGQGYMFSKPVTLKAFEKILDKKKCNPVIVKDSIVHECRRKFSRLKFIQALEAGLTILDIKGKKVNVGNTKVLIKDIGDGGLCFISNIRIPIERDIVLQFTTQLIGKEIKIHGHSVWIEEIDDNLFEYGIEFTFDENKRTDLIDILNRVQIKMKNNILFADGSFISESPYFYFKPQQLTYTE